MGKPRIELYRFHLQQSVIDDQSAELKGEGRALS
jgi:hypothetical protein